MPEAKSVPPGVGGGYWYTPIRARRAHYIRTDGAMLCNPERVFMAAKHITTPPYKTPERCALCEACLKNEGVDSNGHNIASNTSAEVGK